MEFPDYMRIDLNKRDTLVLRGIAISAIVLHNFYHFLSPVRQNEFAFHPWRFWMFLKSLHDPILAIEGFFSFFGHYGVEVFVFLSAYGLAKSHWDDSGSWGRFLWGRIRKLYPVFGLVVLSWLILAVVQEGPMQALRAEGAKLFWMLAGVSDLLPGYGLPPVGPWWFIPFMVQFYALWPLLRRLTNRFGQPGLLALAAVSPILIYTVNPWLTHRSMSLLATPLGHLPEFCLGIIAARFPLRLNAPLVLAAAADLILGSIFGVLWPLTFVSALILILSIYLSMRPILSRSRLLQRIGQYSLLIFLLNGIVRLEFVPYATSPLGGLLLGCASAVTSFAVAAVIQEFLMPVSMPTDSTANSLMIRFRRKPKSASIRESGSHLIPCGGGTRDQD